MSERPDPEVEIDRLVTIVATFEVVRRMILFGSSVAGRRGPDSDLDLLVLVDRDPAGVARQIRERSFGVVRLPLDLIVETTAEFEERSRLPTLERRIAREGRIVYAA